MHKPQIGGIKKKPQLQQAQQKPLQQAKKTQPLQGKAPAPTKDAANGASLKKKQKLGGESASAAAAAPSSSSSVPLLPQLRSADSAFAALLGPNVSPKEFFTKYWEKQPLHVRRAEVEGGAEAARGYYAGLFSKALFDAHVRAHADEMTYGFNLNICVCEDGKKIDKNPPKQKNAAVAEVEVEEEDEEEEEAPKPSKQNRAPPSKQKRALAPADDGEEVETMTIAEALALAEAQKKKLRPGKADPAEEEEDDEDEDEDDEEDEEDEAMLDGEEEDAEDAGEDDEEDGEDGESEDEEEQMDGTSVSTVKQYAPVRFADYARLFSEGCTVQALHPQQYSHPMWLLLSQLEEYFGGLAGANCYLTPPRSQGLAPHYDDVEVFVLQLEGSKAWKLYHPALSLPRTHSGDFAADEIGEPFAELNLQPGDLMYLPRGVIHEARTSNSTSVHMTISVFQKTAWVDFLSSLFSLALNEAFDSKESEAFRKGLPLQYLSYMGSKDAMEREIEEGAPEALGISEEEARARNPHRHRPLRSSALMGASRAQLQQAFHENVDRLLTELRPILMDKIDACADELSADFMTNRLPPAPALDEPSAAAAKPAKKQKKSLESEFPEELGPPPVLDGAQIRLLHPAALRMIVVPAEDSDSDEEDEEEEEEEGQDGEREGQGHILLTHSLRNSREHHLDGRFPPVGPEEASLQLPLYFAPALLQLLNAPRGTFVRVDKLQLEFGGADEGAGDDDEEDEETRRAKRDSQLELANTLWLAKLLQTKMPPVKIAEGADGEDEAPAVAGKKGIKRKGLAAAPAAASASASNGKAGAASPAQSLKKKQKQQHK